MCGLGWFSSSSSSESSSSTLGQNGRTGSPVDDGPPVNRVHPSLKLTDVVVVKSEAIDTVFVAGQFQLRVVGPLQSLRDITAPNFSIVTKLGGQT